MDDKIQLTGEEVIAEQLEYDASPHLDFFNLFFELENAAKDCTNDYLKKLNKKTGKEEPYRYASLESVLKAIRPAAMNHNFAFMTWFSTSLEGTNKVNLQLIHKSFGPYGPVSTFSFPGEGIRGNNYFQALGAGITYIRRYLLASMFGIGAEDDPDAESQSGDDIKAVDVAKTLPKGGTLSIPPVKDDSKNESVGDSTSAPNPKPGPPVFEVD